MPSNRARFLALCLTIIFVVMACSGPVSDTTPSLNGGDQVAGVEINQNRETITITELNAFGGEFGVNFDDFLPVPPGVAFSGPPGLIGNLLPGNGVPGAGIGAGAGIPPGLGTGVGAGIPGIGAGTGIPPGLGAGVGAGIPGIGVGTGIPPGLGTGVGAGIPGIGAGAGIPPGLGTGVGAGIPGIGAGTGIPPGLGTGVGVGIPGIGAGGGIPPGLGTGVGAGIPGIGAGGGIPPGLGAGVGAGTGLPAMPGIGINLADVLLLASTDIAPFDAPWQALDLDLIATIAEQVTNSASFTTNAIAVTMRSCNGGGSVTRTVDDVEPLGFSQGDSHTTVFDNCARGASGNTVINGNRSFNVDGLSGEPFVDLDWSVNSSVNHDISRINKAADRTVSRKGSSVTELVVTNNDQFVQTVIGNDVQAVQRAAGNGSSTNDRQVTFQWLRSDSSYTWDFNVASEHIDEQANLLVQASTTTQMAGIAGQPPTRGSLSVTSFINEVVDQIITATAQEDSQLLVEIDLEGNGSIDSSSTMSWPQFLASIRQLTP